MSKYIEKKNAIYIAKPTLRFPDSLNCEILIK